jgi:hypothetical protein
MTDKTDKATEAKQEAAYKKYEAEQATHEKKHPGEIDEPAYAKYEAAYDKAEGSSKTGDKHAAAKAKYDAALAHAAQLTQAAMEARHKVDSPKTPEMLAWEEAHKKADDARAHAEQLRKEAEALKQEVGP